MSGVIGKATQIAAVLVTFAAVSLAAHGTSIQTKTDASIQDRIEYGLDTSSIVRKYAVTVKVANGEATLSGDVATAAQKTEAARLAKIGGATTVKNNIVVTPDADKSVADRVKAGLNKAGEAITDTWITAKVKWLFLGDDLLKGSNIDVDTADHVVTLKGTVKTAAGRARAVQLATNTDGVHRVVDTLTIAR